MTPPRGSADSSDKGYKTRTAENVETSTLFVFVFSSKIHRELFCATEENIVFFARCKIDIVLLFVVQLISLFSSKIHRELFCATHLFRSTIANISLRCYKNHHTIFILQSISLFSSKIHRELFCAPLPPNTMIKNRFPKNTDANFRMIFFKNSCTKWFSVLAKTTSTIFFTTLFLGGGGRGLLAGRALRNTMLHSCAKIETCEKSCDEFL